MQQASTKIGKFSKYNDQYIEEHLCPVSAGYKMAEPGIDECNGAYEKPVTSKVNMGNT